MNIEHTFQGLHYKNSNGLSLDTIDIKGITDDSREVREGYLFVAVRGEQVDGHQYINEAIHNGAAVIVGEKPFQTEQVPYLIVENSKALLGKLAKNFYGNHMLNKLIIGVTGTNGKTTTSYMIKSMFESNGYRCGVIGTIQNIINGQASQTINTTPNAIKLHQLLHESMDDIIVIEVSSHALKQHRVAGVEFDIAIFTNLEKEHLDYHRSMEEYYKTKLSLFDQLNETGHAIINCNNSWGEKAYHYLKGKHSVKSIGCTDDVNLKLEGTSIKFAHSTEIYDFRLTMPGEHNRINAALTLLTGEVVSLDRQHSLRAVRNFSRLPGRFEIIYFPGNITVVIDYAHTAQGIYYCLQAARELGNPNRLIHVFGFRGNRDESKRADMLINSAKYSDQYILTFDDLNEVAQHEMSNTLEEYHRRFGNENGLVIPDRTRAIEKAIELAGPGDYVVVTGKGHERYQQAYELGTSSDRETVKKFKQVSGDLTV